MAVSGAHAIQRHFPARCLPVIRRSSEALMHIIILTLCDSEKFLLQPAAV